MIPFGEVTSSIRLSHESLEYRGRHRRNKRFACELPRHAVGERLEGNT